MSEEFSKSVSKFNSFRKHTKQVEKRNFVAYKPLFLSKLNRKSKSISYTHNFHVGKINYFNMINAQTEKRTRMKRFFKTYSLFPFFESFNEFLRGFCVLQV